MDARTLGEVLTAGVGACAQRVLEFAALWEVIDGLPVSGDGVTGAELADRVVVLARVRSALDGQIGRVLHAAQERTALTYSAATTLERDAHWSGSQAAAMATASRFAARHAQIAWRWRRGLLATDAIAALARGLRALPADIETALVAEVASVLPGLSVAGVRAFATAAVDRLFPDERDRREQADYERRSLTWTEHGGMTMIHWDLPEVEAATVRAALEAVTTTLRVDGDGVSIHQRRSDAAMTLISKAAAVGVVPTSSHGMPVAATITIPAGDADRVAAGLPRQRVRDLTTLTGPDADGGWVATAGTGTAVTTLGEHAIRFALCAGTWTGVVVDDVTRRGMPITHRLATSTAQPLAVGRSQRLATTAQRIALAVRDGGCLLCRRPAGECQTHHVTDWAAGGGTDLDNVTLLCWSHHREVDLGRWVIERNHDPTPGASWWTYRKVPRHAWTPRPHPTH